MMRAARTVSTFFATGCVALIAGYIVEHGDSHAAQIGASLQSSGMARAAVMPGVPPLPRPPVATFQGVPLPTTGAVVQPESAPLNLQLPDTGGTVTAHCNAHLAAEPSDDAMIRVSLHTPCAMSEPVTIRHAGLSFTEQTNESGRMTVELPALTETAEVEVVMPNGNRHSTVVNVPDAADFRRVALVWRGETGLHIHAQEFGAELGTSGHVWIGSPGLAALGADAKGGFLTTYGDRKLPNAVRAEVYTFPMARKVGREGDVELTIQAEVKNTNCGGIFVAQVAQPDGLGGVDAQELTVRLPGCSQIGEYLVLDDAFRDLRIASK